MHQPIHMFQEVESTNDLALQAARNGAAHGETWVADRQIAGRGRRETGGDRRAWYSPAGSNIYMSTVVRPDVEPSDASKVTVATGFAVAKALRDTTGVDLWLKWPNDLLVGDRKLAGILTEGVFENGRFEAAVVGFGLNINVAASDVPDELSDIMTSLAIESEQNFDRLSLVFTVRNAICEAADQLVAEGLQSFEDIAGRVDRVEGREVQVTANGVPLRATALNIDLQSGGLRVTADGVESVVTAGEARLFL